MSYPIKELPLLVQKNILVQADHDDFLNFCSYPQLAPLCGTNANAQQVYQERCERLFSDELLKYKETTISWRDFYYILHRLISDVDTGELTDEHNLEYYMEDKNSLLLFKLIKEIRTDFVATLGEDLVDLAIELRNYNVLTWLIVDNNIHIMTINPLRLVQIYLYAPFETIDLLISKGKSPRQGDFDWIIRYGRFDILKQIYEK